MLSALSKPCRFKSARAEPTSPILAAPEQDHRARSWRVGDMSTAHEKDEDDILASNTVPDLDRYHESPSRETRKVHPLRSTTILTEFITITTTPKPPPTSSRQLSRPTAELNALDVDDTVSADPFDLAPLPPSEPFDDHPVRVVSESDASPALTNSDSLPTATSDFSQGTEVMDDSPYAVPSTPPPTDESAGPTRGQGDRSRGQGLGVLLTGDCASAEFTLVDGGPTMSFVPFVGCNNNKPRCCPFTPRTTTHIEPTRAGVTSMPSITEARDAQYVYPQAKDAKDATLDSCASDYYSISGSCCPNGYIPWTIALGGETPCVSPMTVGITAPSIPEPTHPAATTKPTVVATGLVFAMQYAVQEEPGHPLSAGVIAGIVIGSICCLLAIVGLAFFVRRRHQHTHQLFNLKKELGSSFYGHSAGTSEVPTLRRDLHFHSGTRDPSSDWARTTLRDSGALAKDQHGIAAGDRDDGSSPAELYADNSPVGPYSPDSAVFPARRPVGSPPKPRKGQQSPRTPINHSGVFELPSVASSPGIAIMGGSASELQLAKPQRLSRGYAKIVYQGRGSTASVPSDIGDREGGGGTAGNSGARPTTASSSKASGSRLATGRMPSTPVLD